MRFFEVYGSPHDMHQNGDIENFNYVFLGDYVDRGVFSLETICLLLALKVRYPEKVHLVRGNHEDKRVNKGYGFFVECSNRLGEDPKDKQSIFSKITQLFEYLPLAALIDDAVLCMHGGIGVGLNYLHEIERIRRPIKVPETAHSLEDQIIIDILWSDPTATDTELGIQPNMTRDPKGKASIYKFGPDRVKTFLKNNHLEFIIRAHECVPQGFQRFAGGKLITVFSATNYCGNHNNVGGFLILTKNLEIKPKLIQPQNLKDSWHNDKDILRKRPPTPSRTMTGFPVQNLNKIV